MMGFVMLAPLGGLTLSFLSAIVYSAVASYTYIHAAGEADLNPSAYIAWQFSIGLGAMLLGSFCGVAFMSNVVRVCIQRKATLAEHEAISSLLSIVCDAVVEIDG
eukprot:10666581-Heterocapsa_arctica.AAC.1